MADIIGPPAQTNIQPPSITEIDGAVGSEYGTAVRECCVLSAREQKTMPDLHWLVCIVLEISWARLKRRKVFIQPAGWGGGGGLQTCHCRRFSSLRRDVSPSLEAD